MTEIPAEIWVSVDASFADWQDEPPPQNSPYRWVKYVPAPEEYVEIDRDGETSLKLPADEAREIQAWIRSRSPSG